MDALTDLLDPRHSILEQTLRAWLPQRRWFRSKSKTLTTVTVEAHAPLGKDGGGPHFCILKTAFTDGTFEHYSLPLVLKSRAEVNALPAAAIVGPMDITTDDMGSEKVLCDASWDPEFRDALFQLLTGNQKVYWAGETGVLEGHAVGGTFSVSASNVLSAEQSNTSFAYASGNFVKLYRRLEEAVNPEPETLRFLREHTNYIHVPRFQASLEWKAEGRIPITVALMQELVDTRGDAWEYTLKNLRQDKSHEPSPGFLAWVALLGERVAELHTALASVSTIPDFAPEPLFATDLEQLRDETRKLLESAFHSLDLSINDPRKSQENRDVTILVKKVLAGRSRLETLIRTAALPEARPQGTQGGQASLALKIRTHGDLHLGQILVGAHSPDDIWILDFEGEPGRPLAEARRKQSPLRDAAGMLRSFHYAAHTVLRGSIHQHEAETLAKHLCTAFLKGYSPAPETAALLDLFMIEKAIYELHYELNNRPDWVEIPLRGLLELIEVVTKDDGKF